MGEHRIHSIDKQRLHRAGLLVCAYCGSRLSPAEATVDHVLPKSLGGRGAWENLVMACAACNLGKGDRVLSAEELGKLEGHRLSVLIRRARKWCAEGEWDILRQGGGQGVGDSGGHVGGM